MGFGADANVTMGCKGGVVALLKADITHLLKYIVWLIAFSYQFLMPFVTNLK